MTPTPFTPIPTLTATAQASPQDPGGADPGFALPTCEPSRGAYDPNANGGLWPLEWRRTAGEGPQPVLADSSNLAGQTVQFALAVRSVDDNGTTDDALWVRPAILCTP